MAFLNSIDNVRSVEWGRKYLWDVKFDGAPKPFDEWFPAVEIDEELATLQTHSVEGYLSSYDIPLRSGQHNLKVTLEDDEDNVLSQWFADWINKEILHLDNPTGSHVSTLSSSVKLFHLIKLNSRRESIQASDYWVFPKGTIVWNGTSQSGSQQFSVNLVISGTVTK